MSQVLANSHHTKVWWCDPDYTSSDSRDAAYLLDEDRIDFIGPKSMDYWARDEGLAQFVGPLTYIGHKNFESRDYYLKPYDTYDGPVHHYAEGMSQEYDHEGINNAGAGHQAASCDNSAEEYFDDKPEAVHVEYAEEPKPAYGSLPVFYIPGAPEAVPKDFVPHDVWRYCEPYEFRIDWENEKSGWEVVDREIMAKYREELEKSYGNPRTVDQLPRYTLAESVPPQTREPPRVPSPVSAPMARPPPSTRLERTKKNVRRLLSKLRIRQSTSSSRT